MGLNPNIINAAGNISHTVANMYTFFSEQCSSVDVSYSGWFGLTTAVAKLIRWSPVSAATFLRRLSMESHANVLDCPIHS